MQTYVKEEEGRGRCLYSNCDIKRGTIIKIEEAVMLSLTNNEFDNYCFYCLKECTRVHRCKKCKVVCYCSKECEKIDNYQHHYECISLKSNSSFSPYSYYFCRIIRLLYNKYSKCNLTCKKEEESIDVADPKQILQFYDFHKIQIKNNPLINYLTTQICQIFSNESWYSESIVSISNIKLIICKLLCNEFNYLNNKFEDIGVCCFPNLSMINHSCCPNCHVITMNRKGYLISHIDIPKDTEITITYVDINLTTEERKKYLLENYNFICDCSRCKNIEFEKKCIELLPSILSNEYLEVIEKIKENESNEDEMKDRFCLLLDKMKIILPPEHEMLNSLEEIIEESY